jgi:hypothetical protein
MAIRPRGRKRSLSKKVSSFNMWMDQVYQVRAIMEATGAVKDAPVIRELLDEALSARRRKVLGITDSEESAGPGNWRNTAHTTNLLLKLNPKPSDRCTWSIALVAGGRLELPTLGL